MKQQELSGPSRSDDEYAWLAEGSMPASREDRIAQGVAVVALLFSLCAGIVIAMLPVSSPGTRTAVVATGDPAARAR